VCNVWCVFFVWFFLIELSDLFFFVFFSVFVCVWGIFFFFWDVCRFRYCRFMGYSLEGRVGMDGSIRCWRGEW